MASNLYETLGLKNDATPEEGKSHPLHSMHFLLLTPEQSEEGLQENGSSNAPRPVASKREHGRQKGSGGTV